MSLSDPNCGPLGYGSVLFAFKCVVFSSPGNTMQRKRLCWVGELAVVVQLPRIMRRKFTAKARKNTETLITGRNQEFFNFTFPSNRIRECINFGSESNDVACPGPGAETRPCGQTPCPGWSSWNNWSSCSASCVGGISFRTRWELFLFKSNLCYVGYRSRFTL